jgi:ribosome-binding protein aMBF1 (putative translation factor)
MAETTSDATEILDRLTGDDPELREMIAEEAVHAQVARMIYEARTAAGLTQKQLADLPGPPDSKA